MNIIDEANAVLFQYWESRGGVYESARRMCVEYRIDQEIYLRIALTCFVFGSVY